MSPRTFFKPSAKDLITINPQLEEQTGYRSMVNDITGLLKIIPDDGAIPREMIVSISREMSRRLNITKPDIIFDLINTLAPVDEYLQRHVLNVGMLNGMMGHWLKLPQAQVDELILLGLLHDCGKVVVPPEILNAPRKLTAIEFEVLKMHTVYGYHLLQEFSEGIRVGTLSHHEKIDGSGYPHGLSQEQLPAAAQITAISDIYDAMVSRRTYKEAITPFSVLANLSVMGGQTLNRDLVDLFIRQMQGELIGRTVLMSNGQTGTINRIDPQDLSYPFVDLGNETIKCDQTLYCISMYGV